MGIEEIHFLYMNGLKKIYLLSTLSSVAFWSLLALCFQQNKEGKPIKVEDRDGEARMKAVQVGEHWAG